MKLILFILIFFLTNQCNSTKASVKDRRNDLGDIISFSFDESIGFELNAIGLSAGVYNGRSLNGCYYSSCDFDSIAEYSSTFLVISGQKLKDDLHLNGDNDFFLRNKKYSTYKKIPLTYFGRIKVRAGFIFGLSLEFNFLELADFALGFAGIDFLEDDYNQYIEELIQNRKRERETGLKNSKLEKRK